ncbi:O-antigen ligase family protein, partial [Clostridium tarantellae]|uniref:O-antigen ligase family protein n=1 Tax=Clostridium tarantellae TaxID=39493 RepID=UPI001478F7BB
INVNHICGLQINILAFQIINIIPVFFISYFVLQEKDIKFHKNVMILILAIFFINIILSFNVLLKDSNAIRILATAKGNEYYSSLGASGFDITYSLVLIIPSLIYFISKCKWSLKIIFSLFLTITLIYIYKSSYTIVIIATILSICIYFFLSFKGFLRYIFVLLGLICTMWLLNPEFIYNTLTLLSEKIGDINISTRINDIGNLIKFNDNTALSLDRLNLYNNSIQAFLQSPILGVFFINPNYVLSGHSTILDILGGLGLVGFVPFIMILYYSYKFSIRYIKNSSYKKCITTSYIVFIFISTLNPQFAASTVMFTLLITVPLLYNLVNDKNVKTSI